MARAAGEIQSHFLPETVGVTVVMVDLLSDGSRVYFNQGTRYTMQLAQVAAAGGSTAITPDSRFRTWWE
jgi:hypothetical protein